MDNLTPPHSARKISEQDQPVFPMTPLIQKTLECLGMELAKSLGMENPRPGMVDSPATCAKCGQKLHATTTGRVLRFCFQCGGEMHPDQLTAPASRPEGAPTFVPLAQKAPITSAQGASADSGPKEPPPQGGEVEQPISNGEAAGSSPARGIPLATPPLAGDDAEVREAVRNAATEFIVNRPTNVSRQFEDLEARILTALTPILAKMEAEIARLKKERDQAILEKVGQHWVDQADAWRAVHAELVDLPQYLACEQKIDTGREHAIRTIRLLVSKLTDAQIERNHWKQQTEWWNRMAVELGELTGTKDNEVPWFETAKARATALRAQLASAQGQLVLQNEKLSNVISTVQWSNELLKETRAQLESTQAEASRWQSEEAQRTRERDEARTLFTRHTEAVAEFLNELYAIMVDPLADGVREVSETKAALLAAAQRDRELTLALTEERAKRGEDSARLDWLEAGHVVRVEAMQGYLPSLLRKWHVFQVENNWKEQGLNTLRTAIDAARTEGQPGGGTT